MGSKQVVLWTSETWWEWMRLQALHNVFNLNLQRNINNYKFAGGIYANYIYIQIVCGQNAVFIISYHQGTCLSHKVWAGTDRNVQLLWSHVSGLLVFTEPCLLINQFYGCFQNISHKFALPQGLKHSSNTSVVYTYSNHISIYHTHINMVHYTYDS
jgi:hypothetical protein